MSIPLEHDYIGLSETCSSMEKRISEKNNNILNLKETELRLGLPGSESPPLSLFGKDLEDKTNNNNNNNNGYAISSLSQVKNFVSGAKRGFSDAIDGSGRWVLSANGGESESKGSALFSPRSVNGGLVNNNNTQQSCLTGFAMKKEVCVTVTVTTPQKNVEEKKTSPANEQQHHATATATATAPAAKAQVVGWPPIRSFRKNTMATNVSKNGDVSEGNTGSGCVYVKVSMDGAPYLRKVDLKTYCNYAQLSSALEKMFSCFTIGQCSSHGVPGREGLSASRLMDIVNCSEYVLTYEDKDGDWMLVGDVPWDMFTDSCKRLRIMKGSEAIGLAPRAMEKCKNRN